MPATRPRRLLVAAAAVVVIAAAIGISVFGMSGRAGSPLTPVAFQLTWNHVGGFAGYYAADQKGDYANEGLSVRFLESGVGIDPVEAVVNGGAQIGIATANHLFHARAAGQPVQVVACIQQINPVLFLTLKESGITHPREFAGKTIRSTAANLPLVRATMLRFGIRPEQYDVVQDFDYNRFYSGEIDVWVGFHFATARRMNNAGHDSNAIYPENFGVHFYHDCIFAIDDFIAEHPDVVLGFLRATLTRGWVYAVRQPQTAGRLTAHYAPDIDQTLASDSMTAIAPLIATGEVEIGWMEPETWAAMADDLVSTGVLDGPIDPTDLYTMRFLEEIYGAAN